ncbi:UNVERIFIED_CONTAM: hypothetical protein FKN15_020035 [Acipenser sinensis]
MLRSCGLGETQQVDLLCGVLEGIAKQEVMVLEEEERGTCAQIWRTLDELYGDKAPGVKLRVDFFAARQNRGGDDRNQEAWHREKRYYGTSWSLDSYLDPFAKSYNDRPPIAPLQELDSWKNSIRAELAKELQEQMRELGEGLKKDSTSHGPAYVGTNRGAPSAHNVAQSGHIRRDCQQQRGGVKVPDRGVVIVEDSALSGAGNPGNERDQPLLGRAIQGSRKVKQEEAPDGKVGTARLTWQQPIQIPPQSEMVVWTQVIEHPARTEYCALVEAIEEDAEWQVARTPAWVLQGGGRSAGRGPAESGCPTSEEESDYGPSELEEETPGAWDLPPDYFFLFRPIFVLHP